MQTEPAVPPVVAMRASTYTPRHVERIRWLSLVTSVMPLPRLKVNPTTGRD